MKRCFVPFTRLPLNSVFGNKQMKNRKNRSHGISIYEMRRLPEMVKVDPKKILSRYDKNDDFFTELYVNHLKGKKKAALTRFSIGRIIPGFYEKNVNGSVLHQRNKLDPKDVKSFIMSISAGRRPILSIYKHPDLNIDSFLCSDDEVAYEAYLQLGIEKVPVVFLDYDVSSFEESALITYIRATPKGPKFFLDKLISYSFDSLPTYIGLDSSKDFESSMDLLMENTSETLEKLRAFHFTGHLDFHYHHTLASILHKVIQSIKAIKVLTNEYLFDQAFNQIRVLYELTLNFYIDWIAPEIIGPYLQFYTVCSKQKWKNFMEGAYDSAKNEGWDNELIRLQKKADNKLGNLLGKVSEKATLNPLHSKHKELYKFLSGITHQDFNTTAKYSYLLENKDSRANSTDQLKYIQLYTDLMVTQILTRISSEIGEPNNRLNAD